MKKHWLFTTLIAVVLCVVCITLFSTDVKAASVDDLGFKLSRDGNTYVVSGCIKSASGALTIPSTYNDKPITAIGDSAFADCESLTSITIPDSVISIGNAAFADCESLTSITIPDSVISIGEYAFYYCTSLTSITIPDSVTSIVDEAFCGCSKLTSITIPDSVTSIGDGAFYDCYSLTSITIPDSVTSIGNFAFEDCSGLTSITIPDSVTSIGQAAFSGCSKLTSITIPDSVTSIGYSAFHGCKSLTSITIPDSVTSIAAEAFCGCSKLTSITIPDSVTSIGYGAFYGCKSLTSITIPAGVTSIGAYTFYGCSSLTSITIPDSVTSIGSFAFEYCDSLTNVFYSGSEGEWDNIMIGSWNEELHGAKIYYNYYQHTHDYNAATCTKPKTCKICGMTSGSAKGHNYADATCTKAKTCKTCGTTSGSAKGHSYAAATCTKAKTCKVCGATSGNAKGHDYKAATCTKAKTCKTCGTTSGKKLGHTYTNDCDTSCNRCGATRSITHNYKTTTTKATLSKNGSIVKKCTTCGKVDSTKAIKYVKTIKLSKTSFVYNGKVKTPTVTVKDSAGKTLKKGTDYDVTYASGRKNAGTYKVTIKFKGNYSGSKTLTFKILPAAKVATQPKTNKVKVGEKIKFTVKATGTGLKYQWQYSTNGKTWKNCSASAAQKASFSFTSKTSHDGNYYRCKVTDSAGNVVYTKAVRAYVLGIEKQPVKKTVTKNKNAKLTVDASGNGLKYQWQYSTDGGKTWKTCSGTAAQKAAFSFKAKISQNGYYFRCKITDSAKNVIYTSKVKLTVKK